MRIFTNVSNTMQKYANIKNIIMLFIAFVIILIAMNKGPIGSAELMKLSGGVGMIDMELGYSPAIAYGMLYNMGSAGRQLYSALLCLDFLFITVFMFLQSLVISKLLKKSGAAEHFKTLSLLPFAGGILDAVENIFILILLFMYPAELVLTAQISNIITILKFIMYGASGMLIFLLGVLSVRKSVTSGTGMKRRSEC